MQPVEVIVVDSKKISCNGQNHKPLNASNHPLVYLNMGAKDNVVCPYCSRYFTTKKPVDTFVADSLKTNSNHS